MQQLGTLTTDELRQLAATRRLVALVPVGSVEPHGPHLPLDTDTRISRAAIERAASRLEGEEVAVLLAPAVAYGVTEFAAGFSGALSIPPDVLTAYLRAVVDGLLGAAGVAHVCLVNNHLEPAHDRAVRAAVAHLAPGRGSVACPLARRWGRTLSDEYRRGNCHAGRYETSLILASDAPLVRVDIAKELPPLDTSLAEGIARGIDTFAGLGLGQAYTGAPAEATAAEGEEMLAQLATMIATEVEEGLALAAGEAVVFATSNPNKVRELGEILGAIGLTVVGLDALGKDVEEPEEDGDTFVANAAIKARAYAAALGCRCLAEDSGLEVDALGGAPGVHSARYAGADGDRPTRDAANNAKLLAAMEGIDERAARFVCSMVVADPDGTILAETRGTFEGTVARAPRGEGGFGYDPLLWLEEEGRTSAELSPEEKNARSHRGEAARAMARLLADLGVRCSRGASG